jgi:tetratricopeptide (TPR) repeat protein
MILEDSSLKAKLGLLVVLAATALIIWGYFGCAPPPPTEPTLTPEQQKAIADSLQKVHDIELAKAYSYAFENYKTARMTENPKHKEIYYRDAVKYFWKMIGLDTESKYNIYGRLSDCYTQLEEPDSAMMVLEMGLAKFPKDTYLNQILGYIYKAKGDNQKALDFYLVALNNEPENQDFLKAVGELYQKLNRVEDAITTYRKYLTLNPDDRSIQEKVTYLVRKTSSPEQYIAELLSYLQNYPDDVSKRYDLAVTYLEGGENDLAVTQLQEVLKRDSLNIRAWEKIANAYENLKRYADAIKAYDKILSADASRKDIICSEVLDYIELNDYPHARQKSQSALALDRSYGKAWVVMGRIYMASADACSRGKQLNYSDKLTYLVAFGLFKRAKEVGDYTARDEADRLTTYLSGSLLIPQKEDWFLNKKELRPKGDCYSWIKPEWDELNYINMYLSQFENP